MDHIIYTIPEECGNRACRAQWHLRHIWKYDDGTFSECDSDGNHDALDAADIPSYNEVCRAWLEYSKYVVQTGEDPLHEFRVARDVTRREAWRVKIAPSICRPVILYGQRAGRFFWARELPEHVRNYFNLNGRHMLADFSTWQEFVEAFPKYKPGTWFCVTVERKVPRRRETIVRELRRAAKAHLRANEW